jgi:hypothetical protein
MKSIYIASKTKHAAKWRSLRAKGVNIISSWIDEAGPGESKNHSESAIRCIRESKSCDAMIVYAEEGDEMVGAFIELGVALADPDPFRKIYLVGPVLKSGSIFIMAPKIQMVASMEDALSEINSL